MERNSFLIVAKDTLANKNISTTAKLLFAQLCDHRNRRTGQCNPKRRTLGSELGVSVATIKRALGELRTAGFLTSRKGQYTNTYELCTRNPVGSNPTGWQNPAGSNPTGQRGQFDPAEASASLYEPYPLNHKGGESTPLFSSEVAIPATRVGGTGALFPIFWQCFVNAGVALNDRDQTAARRVFERYSLEEQEQIGKWVIQQLQTVWRSPQFTPSPLNALRSEGWKRQAAPRIVPKPVTREDEFVRLLRESRARRGYGA
jgi:hypothetical protein